MSGAALLAGHAADLAFGDPRRRHPVAGFGQLALGLERRLYAPSRGRGIAYTAALVGMTAAAAEVIARSRLAGSWTRPLVLAASTWAALGGRSLTQTATRLADLVAQGDLPAARALLPHLCGRDPDALDADGLTRAALESVAENTSDAVVGVLVWGAVAGPGGIVAYRATNTLDAMVGHRSARYRDFGWAAARLDDVVNWLPARLSMVLTAVCAALVGGSPRTTWHVARRDGGAHPSPNAGRVEAAFAGALELRLGGPLSYGGVVEMRPLLGSGRAPSPQDVHRAARLSRAVGLAAALLAAGIRTGIQVASSRATARPTRATTGTAAAGKRT